MNTSIDLSKRFKEERRKRKYTQKELGSLLNVAASMIAYLESGAAWVDTIKPYLNKLEALPAKQPIPTIVHDPKLLQRLTEKKNAAWREYNRLNKILRHAAAGKPIEHLLQEGDKK